MLIETVLLVLQIHCLAHQLPLTRHALSDRAVEVSGQLDRAKTRDKLMGNFKKLFNKPGKK